MELAFAGLHVAVFDSQEPGREASWASAGMISPAPESVAMSSLLSLSVMSAKLYPEFVQRVEELSGQTVGYRPDGALEVFLEAHTKAHVEEVLAMHRSAGTRAEVLSSEQACDMEPALTSEIRDAIHRPDEASVDNRLLTRAVLEVARRKGVEIIAGNAAKALWREGKACKGLRLATGEVEARWTIIAAGCFSDQIEGVSAYAPVIPVKGQIMALRSDSVKLSRVLWSEHIYLVPRNDGRIIAGATVEYEGFDRSITAGGVKEILDGAVSLVPALRKARILETWVGLRPDSRDHLPILGPTDLQGLLIATGHFRNGILLTPITAKLIREWITAQKVSTDWESFSPLRFLEARQTKSA